MRWKQVDVLFSEKSEGPTTLETTVGALFIFINVCTTVVYIFIVLLLTVLISLVLSNVNNANLPFLASTTTEETSLETTTLKNMGQNDSSHTNGENNQEHLNYIIECVFWIYNSFSWIWVIQFTIISVILIALTILFVRSDYYQKNRCMRVKKSYIVKHGPADGEFKEVNLQE